MPDALRKADEVLQQAVQGITDLINVPALINLDFADVQTVMKDKGLAHIGIGSDKGLAHIGIGMATGDDKAIEAVKLAVASPLLETTITGASHVIINISGDISLMDANDAASYVQDLAGDNANIIFGAKFDENMADEAIITVIATGLGESAPSPKVMPGMKFSQNTPPRMAGTAVAARTGATRATPTPFGAAAASPYGTGAGTAGAGQNTAASSNLGVTASTLGIQRPRRPESSIPERDIKIPEFLKSNKK